MKSKQESIPDPPSPMPDKIGNYVIKESLGKGGMGEVFLAYDPACNREVALKRIRTDLTSHEIIKSRFLREALITSQLAHPAIVPIYSIHEDANSFYYIMPYLEGKTLKQLIREALVKEKDKIENPRHFEGSVASFVRIFVSICQAIAYAHSKGFLHRDLKPENVIVGKYGQVLILDWGLVHPINSHSADSEEEPSLSLPAHFDNAPSTLTRPGKIVGTLAYMAPERVFGSPSSVQTDIYSLGVIFYQLLTLHLPFKRHSLAAFKKNAHREELIDAAIVAPYRDIPPELTAIAVKALHPSPELRYQSVDSLISDLENYLEGRFSWFHKADLALKEKQDWEFEENLFIPEHSAITRGAEATDWVTLMISKMSFVGNTQITAQIKIGKLGKGIGLLLNILEASDRVHPTDGYCLWISSEPQHSTKLFRSTIEVMDIPEIILERDVWYALRLEKQDNNIHFYLNDALKFSYISHLPLAGTHIGLLYRDTHFEMSDLSIYIGSQNLMVSCLAVPNAFLANKNYSKALSEYRRIGYSFPGRSEGREALFKAGVTLLEQGKAETDLLRAEQTFLQALEEFEKLHNTPGVPLEYLGKALVYEVLKENEEEVKCLELACRRYSNNPLLKILEEHIFYRMHDSSQHDRIAAYRFMLLVVRHLPSALKNSDHQKIFYRLQHHWESLSFIVESRNETNSLIQNHHFAIRLSFWLAKPYSLVEIINDLANAEPIQEDLIGNALFSLIEMGATTIAERKMSDLKQLPSFSARKTESLIQELELAAKCDQRPLKETIDLFLPLHHQDNSTHRVLFYILEFALRKEDPEWIDYLFFHLPHETLSSDDLFQFSIFRIWGMLLRKEWKKAGELLHNHPQHLLNQESTLLHFLYGCWLCATQGKDTADIHFSEILDMVFPPTYALGAHYLSTKGYVNKRWFDQAFCWEKRHLYQQLVLYYHCANEPDLKAHFKILESQQYLNPDF